MSDLSEQNRKWMEAKVRRDRQFMAILAFHALVIGGAISAFQFEQHQARVDRIDQEKQVVTWAR